MVSIRALSWRSWSMQIMWAVWELQKKVIWGYKFLPNWSLLTFCHKNGHTALRRHTQSLQPSPPKTEYWNLLEKETGLPARCTTLSMHLWPFLFGLASATSLKLTGWLFKPWAERMPSLFSKSCDSYLFGISCIKCLGGRKSRSGIVVCMMLVPTFVFIQVVHSPGVEWEGSQEGFSSSYHQSRVFLLIFQRGKTGGGSHQEMGEHLREAQTSIRFLKLWEYEDMAKQFIKDCAVADLKE